MDQTRGLLSRIGLILLTLAAPGLGLLRLRRWKTAVAIFAITMLVLIFFNFAPPVPFAVLLFAAIISVANLFAALWLTWRNSRNVEACLPWYSHWYSIVGAALFALIINVLLADPHRFAYRNFYMPSDSMAPTLSKSDRFIAYMGSVEPLRRGDVVLVRTRGENIYVKRVAAVGGGRFAIKIGSIVLNGVVVPQRLRRLEKTEGALGTEEVRRLVERFPGERLAHEIYDAGLGPGDDIAELQVPPGSVIVLGDNRDRSVDSRYPVEEGGFGGAVAEADIVGRPYYQSWGSSRPAGTPLFQ